MAIHCLTVWYNHTNIQCDKEYFEIWIQFSFALVGTLFLIIFECIALCCSIFIHIPISVIQLILVWDSTTKCNANYINMSVYKAILLLVLSYIYIM